MMKARNSRTCVYSGNKRETLETVPTQNTCKYNVNNIFTPGQIDHVPFVVLKPVLEKLNPSKLRSLEDLNPHILEKTDCLWQMHCRKEFKNGIPLEHETWRDLHERMTAEKESKLEWIRQKVAATKAKAAEVRMVKLFNTDTTPGYKATGNLSKIAKATSLKGKNVQRILKKSKR